MSAVCPNGHTSGAEDFCDTCGAKIDLENQPEAAAAPEPEAASGSSAAGEGSSEAAAAPEQQVCPNCAAPNTPDALFCEACGYDFTTGALPRGASPKAGEASSGGAEAAAGTPGSIAPAIPLEWVAEVWVDPQWYAVQEAEEPMPSPGLPAVVGLTARSLLIGRVSPSRSIHPDIDCTSDTGVSRRHAQLTTDGQRWWIEDLQSSNGTYIGGAGEPLPTAPVAAGQRVELADDDRVYVGAWTRIVVRQA
jgi:hypothetical protein